MIRFYNGLLLSMDGGMDVSRDEVWVKDDRIIYVGPQQELMPAFERQIDLDGNLLMPGFKNAHAHTAMTFLRTYADGLPLQQWLFEKVFPMEDRLSDEAIYSFTRLGILEYLSGGITGCFDMYYRREPFAQANLDSGFRATICGGSAGYELISREYKRYNSLDPLIKYIPGLHAEYTAGQEDLEAVQQLCRENRAPCFAHNSETRLETEQCRQRRNGMSPTQFFESLGLFDYGGGGFHCIYFSPEDREIFRRRGLWAVSCPGSNAKLASGVMPLVDYMNEGINLALGTDGASSNNALDMFREMYLACVLQKLLLGDAAACPPEGLLDMACRGGAHVMGCPDCDCIAAGKQADMIVIDMQRPEMQPVISPVKNLVYSGSRDAVAMTMVAGRVLYERGEFLTGDDPQELYAVCGGILKKMMESV